MIARALSERQSRDPQPGDYWTGRKVLRANENWRGCTWLGRLIVRLAARRETVEHLGFRFRLGRLWGRPYLISIHPLGGENDQFPPD